MAMGLLVVALVGQRPEVRPEPPRTHYVCRGADIAENVCGGVERKGGKQGVEAAPGACGVVDVVEGAEANRGQPARLYIDVGDGQSPHVVLGAEAVARLQDVWLDPVRLAPCAAPAYVLATNVRQRPRFTGLASITTALHLEQKAPRHHAWTENARPRSPRPGSCIHLLFQVPIQGTEQSVKALAALFKTLSRPFPHERLEQALHWLRALWCARQLVAPVRECCRCCQ
mmetsp:Transcript_118344/g.314967  ORF Transcript_118344/g.314967 Transcript_118344/m.314967 type:complete len:228 (+) Transcript_118344:283-966(+)